MIEIELELQPSEAVPSNGIVKTPALFILDSPAGTVKIATVDYFINLSECPCDPRRRHERLGQKIAVV